MTSKFNIGLKHIHAIAPYVGGRPISEVAREYGLDENKIVKLASNENPLGMPKSAQDAMLKAASDLGRYPDSNGFELKHVLSARLGVGQRRFRPAGCGAKYCCFPSCFFLPSAHLLALLLGQDRGERAQNPSPNSMT
jgi:histidinol-phosphate/aromatic aminotransferase/cobyric acid decarboxylase-like protein